MGVYLDLKKSLQRDLVVFSVTNLTTYQGTAFPASPQIGDTIYRSDEDKLYEYQENVTELGPQWVNVPYDYFFVDFDDHATMQELPNHHLVGTKAISFNIEDQFIFAELLVGVAMMNDRVFKAHDVVVDKLVSRYMPLKTIPIYNQTNGQVQGAFKSYGELEVMGIAKADQRPIQFLSIQLATDRTAK